MTTSSVSIVDNPSRSRFEASVDGQLAGVLAYQDVEARRTLLHTVVGEAFGGHGVGTALAEFALAEARRSGRTIVPQCSFVLGYLAKHPDSFDDVIEAS